MLLEPGFVEVMFVGNYTNSFVGVSVEQFGIFWIGVVRQLLQKIGEVGAIDFPDVIV